MPDPLDYHNHARHLAISYGRLNVVLGPDDLYQVAMVGLLELWRQHPDAEVPLCYTAMRRAVLGQVRRTYREAPTADLTEIANVAAPDAPERDDTWGRVDQILAEIAKLPPKQQEALTRYLRGEDLDQLPRPAPKDRRRKHQYKRIWYWRLVEARRTLRKRLATTA